MIRFWRTWDVEIVSLLLIVVAAVLVGSQVSCSGRAEPAPIIRAPSPGVPPHWFPARWQAPALLCADSRLVWLGDGWGCR